MSATPTGVLSSAVPIVGTLVATGIIAKVGQNTVNSIDRSTRARGASGRRVIASPKRAMPHKSIYKPTSSSRKKSYSVFR